ncbi:hypothetical protein, partial [Salmonella enterica]|uniref:hypothetical protein n=1 Tax=Salmonella enterica TaxID=28901 RepID=UPI003F7B3450
GFLGGAVVGVFCGGAYLLKPLSFWFYGAMVIFIGFLVFVAVGLLGGFLFFNFCLFLRFAGVFLWGLGGLF